MRYTVVLKPILQPTQTTSVQRNETAHTRLVSHSASQLYPQAAKLTL